MNMDNAITLLLTFLPLLGIFLCLPLSERLAKWIALFVSIAGLLIAIKLYFLFDPSSQEPQFAFRALWISSFNIHFALAVEGLSFPLILLTKLMMPVAILASWGEVRRQRAFMVCFLLLDFSMSGTFLATDIFLFYLFWEMMLIPMFLIIGIWGSTERIYAALKFFLFTFAGSIFMLVGIITVFITHNEQFGYYTADISSLYRISLSQVPSLAGLSPSLWVFLAFLVAFAVKVPLLPLHTWLPDAHVQAPTGGSILLAAILLKMGTYGILRFAIPLSPSAFALCIPLLVAMSSIGLLYASWVAFHQTDIKKLVAYSSVSHLALVVLGMCAQNPEALMGAMLQMVNHGLSTGALFLLVGILYERKHSRQFADFGGLASVMPWYCTLLVFAACSSMGVPGLNGFVGEFLILFGMYKASPVWAAIGTTSLVFGAAYLLSMVKKVAYGPLSAENEHLGDLNRRDWMTILPLVIFIIWLGIYPKPFLEKMRRGVENYYSVLGTGVK